MEWNHPFNVAVITIQEIIDKKRPILLVTHDEGHGGWQFMDGSDVSGKKAIAVEKEEILALDPTISEITDLPVGWRAFRKTATAPWIKEANPDALD